MDVADGGGADVMMGGREWASGDNVYMYAGSAYGNSNSPISVVHFDVDEEIIWTGNESGRVVSFYGAQMQRYTAFVTGQAPVRAIESCEESVLTLAPKALRAHHRYGYHQFHYHSEKMTNLTGLHRMPEAPTTIFLGGRQKEFIHIDIEQQRELRCVEVKQKDATIIRSNQKFLLTADTEGQIAVRDASSLEAIRLIAAHGGPIMDFDVCGTQLVTCGTSFRNATYHGDPYMKVYDLRTFRTLPPLPLAFSPSFARFVPTYTDSRVIICSQLGQLQIVDLNSRSSLSMMAEMAGEIVCAFNFSPSKQALAFGDSSGCTHLYTDRRVEEVQMSENNYKTEFADIPVGPPHSFSIEDTTNCLSSIPLPFSSDDGFLSDWPEELCEYVYRERRPLPEYDSVRTVQFLQYARNARAGTPLVRFNVLPYILSENDLAQEAKREEAMLATEAAAAAAAACAPRGPVDSVVVPGAALQCPVAVEEEPEQPVLVPRYYKPVVLNHTRQAHGEDVLTMQRYNKTRRVPLEHYHSSTFANSLVQLLWQAAAIRVPFLLHICMEDEHCVLCQLHFLFRMLSDRPPNQPASSGNLMRALRGNGFSGLLSVVSTGEKVHLLLGLIFDSAQQKLEPSEWQRLRSAVECALTVNVRCVRCSSVRSEDTVQSLLLLQYPSGGQSVSFCSLLEKTLNGRRSCEAECGECRSSTRSEQTLRVRSLPPLLVIDANPIGTNYMHYWKNQLTKIERRPRFGRPPRPDSEKSERPCRWGDECRNRPSCKFHHGSADWASECAAWLEEGAGAWQHVLPPRFFARLSSGITAFQTNSPPKDASDEYVTYELIAMCAQISEDTKVPSWKHVICEVLVTETDSTFDRNKPWLIINGVAVTRVSEDEALALDHRWKLPLVFLYARKGSDVMSEVERRATMPTNIFECDSNLTGKDEVARERREFAVPGIGDIVGIDAEFISMSKDHSRKSVGRVSVVDESGQHVLMDDYIVTCHGDVIHDYLTQYSGIMEADLCRERSTKHLTTLKSAYMKLLHLIERGVIFVGHALCNDFSMLNIYVPNEQMRDTVQLFRLPQQRLISLQFLAWHLLDKKIQESSHDSVEDARIALLLYRKWEELSASGSLDSVIRSLYEKGKATNWRLGDYSGGASVSSMTSSAGSLGGGRGSSASPSKETSPGGSDKS